jgi:hypothetical protein
MPIAGTAAGRSPWKLQPEGALAKLAGRSASRRGDYRDDADRARAGGFPDCTRRSAAADHDTVMDHELWNKDVRCV